MQRFSDILFLAGDSAMQLLLKVCAASAVCFLAQGLAEAAVPESHPAYAKDALIMQPKIENGQIDSMSGIVYSQIKGMRSNRTLRMSVMIPRNNKLKPAIIYFPGGGFTTADFEKYTEMRTALAKAGYVVAAAEYRPVPNKFPALLEDAKAAVRFLREHADQYGIDPSRIGVLGDSAGGYVSLMTAATNGEKEWDKGDFLNQNSDVQAAVSIYGISDLRNIGAGKPEAEAKVHESPAVTEALLVHGPAFAAFPGATIKDNVEKVIKASPVSHVDGSEPPTLLMHGSADPLVSPAQSAQMYKALKSKGVDAKYIILEGAKHGDISWYQPNVIETVVKFYKEKLGEPKDRPASAKAAAGANL